MAFRFFAGILFLFLFPFSMASFVIDCSQAQGSMRGECQKILADDSLVTGHKEVLKFSSISGQVFFTIAIVEDEHYVPEWKRTEKHLNVRTSCRQLADGTRISKQDFPLPTELTKKHYRLNELGQIITELFQKVK